MCDGIKSLSLGTRRLADRYEFISGSLKLWHCKNPSLWPRNENSCKRPLNGL